MRIVVALGGNALLQRGQPMTAEMQRTNVRTAAQQLAPIAEGNELVISHGNGPQVGLLALQAAAYEEVEAYPLDVLGAQTEGMIGYIIEQELGNILPFERPFASILTMIEVDPDDPAFKDPTKFIGPVYSKEDAEALAAEKGWQIKPDGDKWRRVVASPMPKRIFEIRPITWLLEKGAVVICTGGGGIPTMYEPGHEDPRRRRGGHRQGPGQRAPRGAARRRPVRDGDRRRRRLPRLGEAGAAGDRDHDAVGRRGAVAARPDRWGPRWRRPRASSQRTGKRAAIGTLGELQGVVAWTHGTRFEPDAGQ